MSYHARCFTNDHGGLQWQPLRHHLRNVSSMAAQFALIAKDEEFGARAAWAGLIHDFGKYTQAFQEMLRGERPHGVEHSGHGAAYAFQKGHYDIALTVSGHHAGLADPSNIRMRAGQVAQELDSLLEIVHTELGDADITIGKNFVRVLRSMIRILLMFTSACSSVAWWMRIVPMWLGMSLSSTFLKAEDLLKDLLAHIEARSSPWRTGNLPVRKYSMIAWRQRQGRTFTH